MRSTFLTGAALFTAAWLCGCGSDAAPTAPAGNNPAAGPATATVPVIGVSPTSFSFLVYAFRPSYNPPGQKLSITNLGGGALIWTARKSGYWLKLSSTTGTAPSTVTVSVNRASIPIGLNGYRPRYLQGAITVSAAGATTQTIPVLLRISYVR